jgi:microcystin-dependent protein
MSTYSTNLALELIGTGEQSGTWGTTTNTNLGTLIEQAISGYTTYAATGGTDTLTIPNGASGTARNMFIEFTGTGGGTIVVPANKKLYFVYNNTSSAITVKVSGQTGVSVPAAAKMVLVSNGTDIVNAINYLATNAPLAVSSGGTGVASATAYAVQCGGTTSTGAHQSVASVGTSGQVLTSNGAGALPSFQTLVAFTSGMLMPYAGSSAPSGWLLCYGQAISRTTYADLFTAIGTTYGSGDGSTTFNIPDFRGRAAFGKDDMGGSAASRLTTAGSGVDGSTLGTGGGSQLTQQHTHTVTDPGHNHTYNTKSSTAPSGNIITP